MVTLWANSKLLFLLLKSCLCTLVRGPARYRAFFEKVFREMKG